MNKKKTSKKHVFSLADIPRFDVHDEKKFTEFNPELLFKNKDYVAQALLACLIENDTEGFIEILNAYLRINKSQIAHKTDLSRSTVSLALSKKGNPTLKTIAKIIHESVRK